MTWNKKTFYGIYDDSDLVDFLNDNNIKDFKVVKSHVGDIMMKNQIVIVYKLPELTDQEDNK